MATIKREFRNPQGLNEILSELLEHPVNDDWDADIPSESYIGRIKKDEYKGSARGATSQQWGRIMETYAFSYLARHLEASGWKLRRGEMIDGKEYDCLGWRAEHENERMPDLAIEMHFPLPQQSETYLLTYITKQTDKMMQKLEHAEAKHRYIVIGVPPNKRIETIEAPHPLIKVVYQEYKFGTTKPENRRERIFRHVRALFHKWFIRTRN